MINTSARKILGTTCRQCNSTEKDRQLTVCCFITPARSQGFRRALDFLYGTIKKQRRTKQKNNTLFWGGLSTTNNNQTRTHKTSKQQQTTTKKNNKQQDFWWMLAQPPKLQLAWHMAPCGRPWRMGNPDPSCRVNLSSPNGLLGCPWNLVTS